jgi:hypothetical protein
MAISSAKKTNPFQYPHIIPVSVVILINVVESVLPNRSESFGGRRELSLEQSHSVSTPFSRLQDKATMVTTQQSALSNQPQLNSPPS